MSARTLAAGLLVILSVLAFGCGEAPDGGMRPGGSPGSAKVDSPAQPKAPVEPSEREVAIRRHIALYKSQRGDAFVKGRQFLVGVGPDAIPYLLEPRGPELDYQLVELIAEYGQEAVASLSQALKHKDPLVRQGASWALLKLGVLAKDAVPQLTETLKDEVVDVRRSAALALAEVGEPAGSAVPALTRLLSDPNTRWEAVSALGCIGPGAKPAIPQLAEIANGDPEARIRGQACLALGHIGDSSGVPALVKAMQRSHGEVRSNATIAIGMLGANGKEAVPALATALSGDDYDFRAEAAEALGAIGPEAKGAVPAIVENLKDPTIRMAMVNAISGIGPGAVAAVPALIETLGGGSHQSRPDYDLRQAIIKALGAIGSGAVPHLVAALKDDFIWVDACDALAAVGPDARAAVPDLIEEMRTGSRGNRAAPCKALEAIGPGAKDAVPALAAMVVAEDPEVSCDAAIVLGAIGSDAKEAIPALIQASNQQDPITAQEALKALKRVRGQK